MTVVVNNLIITYVGNLPLVGMVVQHICQDTVCMFHYQHILHYQYHMMVHNMADQLAHILYTLILSDTGGFHKLHLNRSTKQYIHCAS